jgi:alkylation response protein AidB-like acyl-CoA dehydrogenase
VTVLPGRSTDLTRRFGTVLFEDVRVAASAAVGVVSRAAAAIERQSNLAVLLQCGEMIGLADSALAMTIGQAVRCRSEAPVFRECPISG